jgi:hypothetical protein
MRFRRAIAFPVAILGIGLFAPLAHGQARGQARGMRGSAGGFRSSSSLRANRGGEFGRQNRRRFENGFGFPFAPFFYPDYYPNNDMDYSAPVPEAPPTPSRMVQPYQAPAPPPIPGNTLILENQDGQWVRIPTGGELSIAAKSPKADSSPSSNSHAANPEATGTEPPRPALPPAVLVFRDGHSEEVQKYMIHGADLYATEAYSTTGSWAKRIPLADLDIPASLKVNKDRSTKFSLPSGPNEVVVRF